MEMMNRLDLIFDVHVHLTNVTYVCGNVDVGATIQKRKLTSCRVSTTTTYPKQAADCHRDGRPKHQNIH